jgi:16S rRNA (cytidine1402-2'-O)-methyltransferase
MSIKTKGTLFLIPSTLAKEGDDVIPDYVKKIAKGIDFFVVENLRSARRYLRSIGFSKNFDEVVFVEIDKHQPEQSDKNVLTYLQSGKDIGLISEAGLPAVADPGNIYVKLAHENGIIVKPLVGPSSILLALMASGMNGQQFRFHGYIPVQQSERIKKIQEMEKVSRKENETQIFIEAPYRNQSLLNDIISSCHSYTLLCIAANLTSSREFIKTQSIKEWKKNIPPINKVPAVFLLHASV